MPVIFSANINRAFAKLDEIRATISSKDVHVFAATESWFTSSHSDHIVSINNFTVYRDDRSDGRVGGGVAVWVKNFLQPSSFTMQGLNHGTNAVCLLFHALKLCLLCIYLL